MKITIVRELVEQCKCVCHGCLRARRQETKGNECLLKSYLRIKQILLDFLESVPGT